MIAGSIAFEASPAGKGKRALPASPMSMKTISSVFAARLLTVVEGDESLTQFFDEGWDPERIDPDVLSSRSHRLARVDPTMRATIAFESLEDGDNSPPQVGGGPIDQLAAHGYSVH